MTRAADTLMSRDDNDLPPAEFAFPGPLRDQLVAAILNGSKTSTTSLFVQYSSGDEPLPIVGQRQRVMDSHGLPLAVIEIVAVRTVRLADVDLEHARDEGEGFDSVDAWRATHENFWHSADMRRDLDDPAFTTNDNTQVVLERFRVARVLGTPS
jgi:uncharacterized protein YhfF